MGQLSTELRPKLARLVPLLGSDKPGEVTATVAAIGRTLAAARCDWHDLALVIEGDPPGRSHDRSERRAEDLYTDWPVRWSTSTERYFVMDGLWYGLSHGIFTNDFEQRFARDIADRIDAEDCRFTEKQIATINKLLAKLRRGGRAPS